MYDCARLDGLYVRNTPSKGIGVFCKNDILQGQIIETSPAIIFNDREALFIDKTVFYNYYFKIPSLSPSLQETHGVENHDKSGCLPMGLISYCNHSDTPNARIEKNIRDNTLLFSLIALEQIPAHQEICHSYGFIWFEKAP